MLYFNFTSLFELWNVYLVVYLLEYFLRSCVIDYQDQEDFFYVHLRFVLSPVVITVVPWIFQMLEWRRIFNPLI